MLSILAPIFLAARSNGRGGRGANAKDTEVSNYLAFLLINQIHGLYFFFFLPTSGTGKIKHCHEHEHFGGNSALTAWRADMRLASAH
jgi:hypothetical protein